MGQEVTPMAQKSAIFTLFQNLLGFFFTLKKKIEGVDRMTQKTLFSEFYYFSFLWQNYFFKLILGLEVITLKTTHFLKIIYEFVVYMEFEERIEGVERLQ